MLVRELRELLADEDQEAEVRFAYNYGDHWRTKVAAKIRRVEELPIKYSDYHSMDKVVDDEDDDATLAVVISS